MQKVDKAADCRKHRANEMRQKFCLPDVDAQHVGALLVSAHSVKAAAQLCPAQERKEQKHDDDCHHRANFNIRRNPLAQLVDGTHARNVNARFKQFDKGLVLYVELR